MCSESSIEKIRELLLVANEEEAESIRLYLEMEEARRRA